MVNGKAPFDAKAAQANADLVVTLARLPWSAFVDGSDKGDTNARPEVWSQPDKFKAAAQRLQDATVKLRRRREDRQAGRPQDRRSARPPRPASRATTTSARSTDLGLDCAAMRTLPPSCDRPPP